MLFAVFAESPTNGSVMLSKLLQPENVPFEIFVTRFGTIYSVFDLSLTPVIVIFVPEIVKTKSARSAYSSLISHLASMFW